MNIRKAALLLTALALVQFACCETGTRGTAERAKPLWLAVGSHELIEHVRPLAEQRRSQGLEVAMTTQPLTAELIAGYRPSYLLLVGDVNETTGSKTMHVPTCKREMYRWQSQQLPHFVSDQAWGDADGDGRPEFPVGRIPAADPSALAAVVRKIIAYENQAATEADLALPMWAGSPSYGPFLDGIATAAFVSAVDLYAPSWARPRVLAADPKHPLCGVPSEQALTFTRQLRLGGMLSFLAGHGAREYFNARIDQEGWVFSCADAALLQTGAPVAPLVILACDCGDYAGKTDCFAESLLWMPGGPTAVIAASANSHPMTNSFTFISTLKQLDRGPARLGDMWLAAQIDAHGSRDLLIERFLLNAEGHLGAGIDQQQLRRDQMLLYNLLGDPAMTLKIPAAMQCELTTSGDAWHWRVPAEEGIISVSAAVRWERNRGMTAMAEHSGCSSDQDTTAAAKANYRAFDLRFAYEPVSFERSATGWEGSVPRGAAGHLRIVGSGPAGIRVVSLKLQ